MTYFEQYVPYFKLMDYTIKVECKSHNSQIREIQIRGNKKCLKISMMSISNRQ